MRVAAAAALTLAALLSGGTVAAQGRPQGVVVVSVLETPGLAPLSLVTVQFAGLPQTLQTDSSGVVLFRDVPSGPRSLQARRLGYTRASAVVRVGAGDTAQVTVFMRAMSSRLPAVSVKEKATRANLREFEQRRRMGTGRYITEDQIDAAVGADLNTLVARIGLKADDTVWNHRGPSGHCPLTVYLNGMHLRGDAVTDVVEPLGLAGVEYYTGPFIPVQYRTGTSAKCGVVLFWSK